MLAHRAADVPVLDILPHELQRVLRRGLRCSTGTHGLLHDGYHLVLTEVGRERLLRIVPRCSGLWHFAGDEAPGDKRHRVVGARLPCKSIPRRIDQRTTSSVQLAQQLKQRQRRQRSVPAARNAWRRCGVICSLMKFRISSYSRLPLRACEHPG
jgi:hypothetical protein